GGRQARISRRRLARALDSVMSSAKTKPKKQERADSSRDGQAPAPAERREQSAAAPSPFPPIAEYAFLSNCHTGALIAADGAVDWLCVPRFDSPSVFATLL